MRRYTDQDRRRSAVTRRRNARLRRQNSPTVVRRQEKPTVELALGVVVTRGVENRLTRKADAEVPPEKMSVAGWIAIGLSWVLCLPFMGLSVDGEQPGWRFLFLLLPLGVSAFFGTRSANRRQAEVAGRAGQLARERRERLDETQQFYSSPEWQTLRERVIREEGRICVECGRRIRNKSDVTVDHIRPRSKYPDLAFDRQNLRVLCRRCNSSKGDKD